MAAYMKMWAAWRQSSKIEIVCQRSKIPTLCRNSTFTRPCGSYPIAAQRMYSTNGFFAQLPVSSARSGFASTAWAARSVHLRPWTRVTGGFSGVWNTRDAVIHIQTRSLFGNRGSSFSGDDGAESSDSGVGDESRDGGDGGAAYSPPQMTALTPMLVPEVFPNVPLIAVSRNPVFPRFIKIIEVSNFLTALGVNLIKVA